RAKRLNQIFGYSRPGRRRNHQKRQEGAAREPSENESGKPPLEAPTITSASVETLGGPDFTESFIVLRGSGELEAPLDAASHAAISAAFSPGVVLQERYALERELGRGVMGLVFLARDKRLDRPVAVKVISFRRFQGRSSLSAQARNAFEEE